MPDKTTQGERRNATQDEESRVIYTYSITGPTMPLPDIEIPARNERTDNQPNAVKRKG